MQHATELSRPGSARSATRRLPSPAAIRRRLAEVPAWAAVAELFIALGWLRAGVEKLIDPSWWTGDGLSTFLSEHDGAALAWFEPFLTGVVEPWWWAVTAFIPLLQFALAAALFRGGTWRVPGLLAGIGLNLVFIAAGAVNPSIFYILLQAGVLLWLVERDRSGRNTAWLDIAVGVAGFLGSASIFSIRTLAPAGAVDDPGLIMVTLAGLTLLARLVIGARRSVAAAPSAGSESPARSSIRDVGRRRWEADADLLATLPSGFATVHSRLSLAGRVPPRREGTCARCSGA